MTTSESREGHKGRLMVVIASTRPGRVGLPVGRWILARAEADGRFEVDTVDLAELDLPFMNEPEHPRLRRYRHEHTRRWSARVAAADAFVFVMPEYNHGFNAPLKNAVDYLSLEWNYKPVGFVSYGGVSAGTRAMQMMKQVVAAVKMVPLNDAVNIPFVRERLTETGDEIEPNEIMNAAADQMLSELDKTYRALAPLRPGLD